MEPFHQRGHCFCRWLRSMSFCFLILRLYPVRTYGAKLLSPVAGSFMSITSAPPLQIGGASLQIEFAGTGPDLPKTYIIANISKAAQAVATYYGRFPVSSARIQIVVATGEHGVLRGTTWGSKDGFPAVSRLIVGQHTTQQEFDADWIVTHELVHMALASLPDAQHWLEEGIATYVEPLVRSQPDNSGSNECGPTCCQVGGTANRKHSTAAWIGLIPGAAPTGAEPCFVWWPMLKYAGRRTTGTACRMRFGRLSQRVALSTKIGPWYAS
jgi:hypothetical protein